MRRILRQRGVSLTSLLICTLLLNHPPATAGELTPLSQYVHKIYSSEEGLPQNSGRALLQTRDGFIWIGTQDGLVRFNGDVFRVFDKDNTPGIHHNDVTSLLETDDSTLWIGTYNGLTSLKDGVFIYHPVTGGQAPEVVRALAADHEGTLWIGTMDAGVRKYRNGKAESITTSQGICSNSIYAIAEDHQHNIWIGTDAGVSVRQEGRWLSYHKKDGLPSETIRSICVTSDGTVWLGTGQGLVARRGEGFRTYTVADGLSNEIVRTIYEDRSGTLWVGTERGGVCQYSHGVFLPYRSMDGLSGDLVVSVLEDREGSLWIGTYSSGVNQFWRGKFRNYTSKDGLPDDNFTSLVQTRNGDIWIGSGGSGLIRFDGKTFTAYTTAHGLPGNSIRSLFEDAAGTLWIGTQSGLAHYRNGKFHSDGPEEGMEESYIRAIAEDHERCLWVGTLNSGVYRLENHRFTSCSSKGVTADVIRSLLVDHNGSVWVGSNDALTCYRSGTATVLTQKDGLPTEPIYDMLEDSEHTLWLGSYGGGLVRLKDNKITRFKRSDGLSDDVVYQIVEDGSGYLWLTSMKGISRVSKTSLDEFAEGKADHIESTLFTSSDGMVISECTGNAQASGFRASDGRLWFATTKGVVVVDQKRLARNSLPPPVVIERVVINNVELRINDSVSVPPGNGQAEFHFGGMSFIAPRKVMFKYRLEGFEPHWVEAGTRHVAFYTNLPPGRYVFHVTACNSDGVWNESGASFAFTLEPHFWQTTWFASLFVLCILGFGFGAYRLRVMRLLKREKELSTRVDDALAKIKMLDGLIPICSNCKKIRNDKGYWDQLEGYIQTHSEAKFSHGICPECASILYPEYYKKTD